MRHLGRNIALIAIVLILAITSIIPPKENLRLGRDLAGGVSLVYTVDVPPEENADTVIPQVIRVLSERINPKGLFEISFVRQGRERLVVSMPLPSQEVQDLRRAYEEALEALRDYDFDLATFERAMREEGKARTDALDAMIGDSAGREALLGPVRELAAEEDRALQAYNEAEALQSVVVEPTQEQQAELDELENAVVMARVELQAARDRAVRLRVSPEDMRDALSRSETGARLKNENAISEEDEYVTIPSPRERALSVLKEQIEQIGGADAYQKVIDTYAAYRSKRTGLDDPDDLERALSGAGVLEFRITAQRAEVPDLQEMRDRLIERGPNSIQNDDFVWAPLNKILDWVNNDAQQLQSVQDNPSAFFNAQGFIVEERPEDGQYYMLLSNRGDQRLTRQEGNWALARSFRGNDKIGRPAINFRMDPRGATKLADLTGNNVGRQMAVLLDGQVYTAPNLLGPISDSGQITGNFSEREIAEIIRTLNAGSLQASLSDEPISRSVLAPELGLDNLQKGLKASLFALVLVGIFMAFYYFTSGFVAMFALACNALIILGAMSLNRAAFTLPGIAGIVLTFGMAVDANVLIYERIREELFAGEDPKTAVRIAYQKVLSTIVDANVTNLIVCVVLAYTASQEIKGFAITLGIGVVATMFSALLITRVLFSIMIDKFRITSPWLLAQLPAKVRAVDRLLTPRINWIGLRPVFVFISLAFVGLGVFFIVVQQEKMLDTEFVGGTQIDLKLAGEDGEVVTLKRSDVDTRVQAIADAAAERVASGQAAPERISSIDYKVTESESGLTLSKRKNVAPDADLKHAVTYAQVVDWLESQNAFGNADAPSSFSLSTGGAADSTDVANGEAVLVSSPEGYRIDLSVELASPDVLLAELGNAEVVAVDPLPDGLTASRFQIKTAVADAGLIQTEIVRAFEDVVSSQPALSFEGSDIDDFRSSGVVFTAPETTLGENIFEPGITNDVTPFVDGVIILLNNLEPQPSLDTLEERLGYIRQQSVYAGDALGRPFDVIVLEGTDSAVSRAAILARETGINPRDNAEQWELFAQQEWEIARTGLAEAQTLAGVESFSPEIAATFRNQAIVAVVLSFMLITMYIWARFGSVRYSLAALSCLAHDVIIAIGLIALAEILYDNIPFAAAIGVQPFKIDLGLVAAILTIIGYSLNDTIIILDRIRENRGKLAYASKEVINLSINQTISRTLITSGTTLVALIVMFVVGGEGIASFTYAMICGVIVGTYSSIAVAAPLVYTSKIPEAAKVFHDRYGARENPAEDGDQ